MRKTIVIAAALPFVLATAGCSDFTSLSNSAQNLAGRWNVGPTSRNLPNDPDGLDAEVKNVIASVSVDNVEIRAMRLPSSDALTGERIVIDAQALQTVFPPGVYTLSSAYARNRAGALAFSQSVADIVQRVMADRDKLHVAVELHATYFGGADGIPIGKNGGVYGNEFGPIELGPEVLTIDGKPASVAIHGNQKVNNAELAILRAAALRHEFMGQFKADMDMSEQWVIATSPQIGATHRFARIELVFRPLDGSHPKPVA